MTEPVGNDNVFRRNYCKSVFYLYLCRRRGGRHTTCPLMPSKKSCFGSFFYMGISHSIASFSTIQTTRFIVWSYRCESLSSKNLSHPSSILPKENNCFLWKYRITHSTPCLVALCSLSFTAHFPKPSIDLMSIMIPSRNPSGVFTPFGANSDSSVIQCPLFLKISTVILSYSPIFIPNAPISESNLCSRWIALMPPDCSSKETSE